MILKITIKILLLLIILYGIWYLYEFINPWLSIILLILLIARTTDQIIKQLKTKN